MTSNNMTDDNNDNNNESIREVQTAQLRRESASDTSYLVSLTPAIRAAGLEDGGSFRFDPQAVPELGMLPAIGSEVEVDGRGDPLARNIRKQGTGGKTLRLVIPHEGLESLGIDPDTIDDDDPPELNVWAGEQLLAFELPEQRQVEIDRTPGRRREENDENA